MVKKDKAQRTLDKTKQLKIQNKEYRDAET